MGLFTRAGGQGGNYGDWWRAAGAGCKVAGIHSRGSQEKTLTRDWSQETCLL